jgi:hypothetical protein
MIRFWLNYKLCVYGALAALFLFMYGIDLVCGIDNIINYPLF